MDKDNSAKQDILNRYVEVTGIELKHRYLFMLTASMMGVTFLLAAFHLAFVTFIPTFVLACLWVIIVLPGHFQAMSKLRSEFGANVQLDPLFQFKCIFNALRPTKKEQESHSFLLPLFFTSLAFPLICFITMLMVEQ